mmetsp:Transcript_48502/g.128522  ORF Transcript_48502/g.128522 Transcript_48502/m.128522 type:complete len:225 (+) Transcript_48502:1374-2048(+)
MLPRGGEVVNHLLSLLSEPVGSCVPLLQANDTLRHLFLVLEHIHHDLDSKFEAVHWTDFLCDRVRFLHHQRSFAKLFCEQLSTRGAQPVLQLFDVPVALLVRLCLLWHDLSQSAVQARHGGTLIVLMPRDNKVETRGVAEDHSVTMVEILCFVDPTTVDENAAFQRHDPDIEVLVTTEGRHLVERAKAHELCVALRSRSHNDATVLRHKVNEASGERRVVVQID